MLFCITHFHLSSGSSNYIKTKIRLIYLQTEDIGARQGSYPVTYNTKWQKFESIMDIMNASHACLELTPCF